MANTSRPGLKRGRSGRFGNTLSCLALPGLILLAALAATPAWAATKLVVCNASGTSYGFVPPSIGMQQGIFQKNGIEVEDVALDGSAKLHQAMAAGSCDIGLGAGSDLTFVVKGAPEIAVGELAGPPLPFSFIVADDAGIKSKADLKGKRVGVSTPNSLTQWLALRFVQEQGWKPSDITLVFVGSLTPGQAAALETHQIDAMVGATALGLQLAEKHKAHDLFPGSEVQQDYITNLIFASNKLAADNPDAVRAFLKGWYQTIAFMRAHKPETVAAEQLRSGYDDQVEGQEYDIVTPMFSTDGKFSQSGLTVLEQSFADMKLLDSAPDLSKYYTERFLPGG